jgi:putative ABC transport system permease protein
MWFAAFRDLIWRRRRYLISVLGTSLVFALSLLMTGMSASFPAAVDGTFEHLEAAEFVVPEGVTGPLTANRPFDPAQLPDGVVPMASLTARIGSSPGVPVSAIGLGEGAAGLQVAEGASPSGDAEIAVAAGNGWDVGDEVSVAGLPMTVTGLLPDLTLGAGTPVAVMPLTTFQRAFFDGAPLATAGLAEQTGVTAGGGFEVVTTQAAKDDLLEILGDAISTIGLVRILLWIVAGLIVGSVIFLSAVERTRDFAVFKAIGASTRGMAGGVIFQGLTVALASTLVGTALALLIGPTFPMQVTFTASGLVTMPVVAVTIGLIASLFGLRRAVKVEPALAFGGAA